MPKSKIVKENPDDEEIPFVIIQEAIIELSKIGRNIKKSQLTERAIFLLIKDMTNTPLIWIKKVLNALPELEKMYIKQPKKKLRKEK